MIHLMTEKKLINLIIGKTIPLFWVMNHRVSSYLIPKPHYRLEDYSYIYL